MFEKRYALTLVYLTKGERERDEKTEKRSELCVCEAHLTSRLLRKESVLFVYFRASRVYDTVLKSK